MSATTPYSMCYLYSEFPRGFIQFRSGLPSCSRSRRSGDFGSPDIASGVPHATVEIRQLRVPLTVVGKTRVVRRVGLEAPTCRGFAQHHVVDLCCTGRSCNSSRTDERAGHEQCSNSKRCCNSFETFHQRPNGLVER
jgi:hypothetical protein